MSARLVRRTFASPFVVTLAAAAIPTAACYVQPAPGAQAPRSTDHRDGSTRQTTDENAPNHTNPPRPTTGDPAGTMPAPDHGATNAGVERAPPATGGKVVVIANPPRPVAAPATLPASKSERSWTVTRAAGTCSASMTTSCPKPLPGKVAPTCNPPAPTSYACLPTLADGGKVMIVLFAGQTECQIQPAPMNCPPNAICNPPPPQKVACPQ